jgi:hypothetical protein
MDMAKKESDTDKKLRLLIAKVSRLEKRIKELEIENKKKDMDEITQVEERLNMPAK